MHADSCLHHPFTDPFCMVPMWKYEVKIMSIQSTSFGFDLLFNFSTSLKEREEKSAELAVPQNTDMQYGNLALAQFFKQCWVQVVSESRTEL